MNIKTIISLWFITLASPQLAQAQLKTQGLLGVSSGYISQRAQLTGTMDYTQIALPPGLFKTYYQHNLHDSSALAGVLGGIQFSCNDWLLGLEVAADWHDIDQRLGFAQADRLGARGWGAVADYDKGASISLSLRWGYQVTTYLMPYIRLGAETSHDKLTVNFYGAPEYPGQYQTTDKKQMYRYLVGFGAESVVPYFCFLKLRLEYNYLSRGQRLRSQGLIIDNTTNPFFINQSLAKYHVWKLAVVWPFG